MVNTQIMQDTRRRVKLYELNAERQWDDKGTGEAKKKIHEKKLNENIYHRSCEQHLCGEAEGNFTCSQVGGRWVSG